MAPGKGESQTQTSTAIVRVGAGPHGTATRSGRPAARYWAGDDVSITSALEGRSWHGASGFDDFLTSFGESMEWTGEVESATELDPERVLLVAVVTTRGKSSDVGLSERRWVVMTVREGQVVRSESYSSREAALEAVGLRE